ncbi:MAG TPA: Ig-like domain-containing protein, partial [Caulobacteraceae bacterium]|nr:Ig-like domain-containing protein [Caulobacteraceae bacterium]
VVTGPAHGTLTLNANGSFTYTPALGFAGKDTFTYVASDSLASSAPTTVTITVAASPPTGAADAYKDAAGHALTVTAANGVLANDTDPNGLGLTAAVVTGPAHGTLTLNADGSFTYTPTLGFAGKDAFTYAASDSLASSPPVTVTLNVAASPPTGAADAYKDAAGHALTVTAANGVLANDADPNGLALTAAVVTGPAHGTLTLNANGSFTYTPTLGFAGKDAFTYIASDSLASSAPTTVTLTVTASPPTSVADSYTDPAGHAFTVTAAGGVLANDTDANGLALTASVAPGLGPKHGTLTLNKDGSFTYTPNAGFAGTDSFDYIASDSLSAGAPTLVTLTVTASPPVARSDTYDAVANQTLTVDAAHGVLANDTDPNGFTLTAALAPGGGPEYGTVTLNADGSFTYILNSGFGGFTGVDTFSYIASDGVTQSAPTTVTIDVSNGTAAIAPKPAPLLAQAAAGMGETAPAPHSTAPEATGPGPARLFAAPSHVALS